MLTKSMRLAYLVLATLFASAAHAEEGDYSALQTLWNLAFPPGPDNPVRASETTGTYGLKRNPAGYADGWQPGALLQVADRQARAVHRRGLRQRLAIQVLRQSRAEHA